MKKKTIIIIIAAVLLAVAGGILLVNLVKKNEWAKQELLEYSTHRGGGMRGGSSGTIVSAYGDKALLTYSSAEWHYQDPVITEYLINGAVLDEIKETAIDEGMYKWAGKKFTNLFVADGESTSYDFIFSEDSFNFHSQIYPEPYKSKLAKLDGIIEKYSVDGERLPGLVVPTLSEEEQVSRRDPEDGKVKLEVYEYSQNHLRYWISNGTDNEKTLEGTYSITDEKGNIVVSNPEKCAYSVSCYPQSNSEDSIELENRLKPGKYTLTVGDLSCGFEIR